LDVCLLVLLSSICAAVAEDGELPVRNYVLTSRCEALLTSEHEAALENGRKNGGALNRGPGRYFLESRGIEFPYRASAILEDGAILKVINSAALGGGELTWEDAIRDKTKRFQLRRMSAQKIRQGERLLKLFDASARRILGAEFKEVGQLKLSARHYHAILERGVEAAVQDRVLPKGDGVQFPELGVAATTSPSFEKVVITDQVVAKLKDVLPQTYVFDVESQQRVIEIRKREAGGFVSLQESNPKRQKQNEVIDVSPDLDGGLRLTDGKVIYELKPVLWGTELVVWEAEPNKLKRF
jgi:hypothetical protein